MYYLGKYYILESDAKYRCGHDNEIASLKEKLQKEKEWRVRLANDCNKQADAISRRNALITDLRGRITTPLTPNEIKIEVKKVMGYEGRDSNLLSVTKCSKGNVKNCIGQICPAWDRCCNKHRIVKLKK